MISNECHRKSAKVIPINNRDAGARNEDRLAARDEALSQQIVVILKDMLQSLKGPNK